MEKHVIALSNGKKLNKSEFVHYFERKVLRTIRKYSLVDYEDKILVACSEGNSNVALYILNKLCKNRNQRIKAIAFDGGIKSNRNKIFKDLDEFCKKHDIEFEIINSKKEYPSLEEIYKKAEEQGFNVVALGDSLDDEAEAIILNQMKGSPVPMPKFGPSSVNEKNDGFMRSIKPLYLCSEKEIMLYSKLKKIPMCLEVPSKKNDEFRAEIKSFLKDMEKKHIEIKNAIVQSFLSAIFKNSN